MSEVDQDKVGAITTPANKNDLRSLKHKRSVVKGHTTRFNTFLSSFDNIQITQSDKNQIKVRKNKFEVIYEQFQETQTSIELLTGVTDEKERDEFESTYFNAIALAESYITESNNTVIQSQAKNQFHDDDIKLPTLNLPTFDGSYENWLLFCDTFEAIINQNAKLSNVRKFQYLQASLQGEALNVVRSLEISNNTYEVAWNLLRKRYDNKKLMISTHIKAIFNITEVTKESHVTLRNLCDSLQKHLRALEMLKQPVKKWDLILLHVMSSKLDYNTNKEWETLISKKSEDDMPTVNELIEFLHQRCRLLETIQKTTTEKNKNTDTYKNQYAKRKPERSAAFIATTEQCDLCKENHQIYTCKTFLDMSTTDRIEYIKKSKRCYNCLKTNHFTQNCKSGNCKFCKRKHASLLHLDSFKSHVDQKSQETNTQVQSTSQPQQNSSQDLVHTISCHSVESATNQTILSTALVMIPDVNGQKKLFRALLDTASQSSFLNEQACNELGLRTNKLSHIVTGFGNSTNVVNKETTITLCSTTSEYHTSTRVLIVPRITNNLPPVSIPKSALQIPHNIVLADPQFYNSSKIDLLLGAGIFYDLLLSGRTKSSQNALTFVETTLGWIAGGQACITNNRQNSEQSVCNLTLHKQMELFWKIEELDEVRNWSKEEQECEDHFVENFTRQPDGAFVVKLPFNQNKQKIGESKCVALKRFLTQEKRLLHNKSLHKQYCEFMNEYECTGHMTPINNIPSEHYFMPHHAVQKGDSLTTKLRVVFDGSAASSTGVSFNQALKKGPIIQDELLQILLRFRLHTVVLTADIAKMYRQVQVDSQDANYQLIFWRQDPSHKLQTFKLNTVTYGTTTAPFLAVRCLKQLAIEERENFSDASDTLETDFNVDDLLTGCDTEQKAVQLAKDLMTILKKGHFELRKWCSNSQEVIRGITESTLNTKSLDHMVITDSESIKTLGLRWNVKQDSFEYTIAEDTLNYNNISKRTILSTIAKLYDPMGLLGPIVIIAKLIIQQIWQLKTSWDESVPTEIAKKWITFMDDLHRIKQLHIPRKITDFNSYEIIEIHGFCDASELAYGACIYIRTTNSNGIHSSHLLCSKSRVAPLKKVSLPRLELCGAVLLSQLVQKVKASFKISFNRIILWTDSTITLAWIQMCPSVCKTFVANRVSIIQRLTPDVTWRHVPGKENPADLISRGKYPSEMIDNRDWWKGPSWLLQNETAWPAPQTREFHTYDDTALEKKKEQTLTHVTTIDSEIFDRYSSLTKLMSVTAWCLRFKHNVFNKNDKLLGPLTVKELNLATTRLVKLAQQAEYSREIEDLKVNKSIHSSSKILALRPYLDDNQIVRVGGRIMHANIPDAQKHPYLLPTKHPLTTLIIRYTHEQQLHAGPQATLYTLRLKYWIPAARSAVKKIVRSCVTCFKVSPKTLSQGMGNLPYRRVQETRPFEVTGIDFGGPMLIRESHRRGRVPLNKCYIAVFVCFVTKAIHLELVSSLSTEAFLGALRRFVSRRGHCKHIYSDNATNFQGANNDLKQLSKLLNNKDTQDIVSKNLATKDITWHFIPPRSPHFGGLWEAAVKSVKRHIRKVIGKTILTFEEYYTILTQVELCVNSRPLTPLSDDPSELHALTPNHFLLGDSFTGYQEPELTTMKPNLLNRWQHVQRVTQDIRKRWKKEYLLTLQQRSKWRKEHANLEVGDMVLVTSQMTADTWPLGRVTEIHPGSDGLVRVATIKLQSGCVTRAITNLAKLPI